MISLLLFLCLQPFWYFGGQGTADLIETMANPAIGGSTVPYGYADAGEAQLHCMSQRYYLCNISIGYLYAYACPLGYFVIEAPQ